MPRRKSVKICTKGLARDYPEWLTYPEAVRNFFALMWWTLVVVVLTCLTYN